MIKFNCLKCGKEFKSKDEYAGRKFTCTECSNECRIPTPKTLRQPSAIAAAEPVPLNASRMPAPLQPSKAAAKPPEEAFDFFSFAGTSQDSSTPSATLEKRKPIPLKEPTDEPSAPPDELSTFEAVHTDPHQTAATILAKPQVRPKVFQVVAGLLLLIVGGIGAFWLLPASSPPPESPKVPAGKVVESPKEAPEVVTFRKDVANFAKETRIAVKLFASGTTKKAAVEKYEYLVDLISRIDQPIRLVSPDGLDVGPRLLLISSEIAAIKMWFTLPIRFYDRDQTDVYTKILECSIAIDTHLENLYAPLTAKEQADVAALLKQ